MSNTTEEFWRARLLDYFSDMQCDDLITEEEMENEMDKVAFMSNVQCKRKWKYIQKKNREVSFK